MPKEKTAAQKRDEFLRRVSATFTGEDIGITKPEGQDQSQKARNARRKRREAKKNK